MIKLYCSRCNKCMTDKDGVSCVGVSIQLSSGDRPEFIKLQSGKYNSNAEYNFCWECWIDSLMGIK